MAWFDQDYVIRLIQQSKDKKGLLTHDHPSHKGGEEEHKINNKKVKERTNFKSIPFPKEQRLQQCSCYSCLDMETSCRDGGCRDMCRVSGRTLRMPYFVNSGEGLLMRDAYDNLASDDVASDDVSSGALLQTRYFRHASSDAYLQMHFFRCFQQIGRAHV